MSSAVVKPDKTIDVRGQICPYPIIHTKNALKSLVSGQVLLVMTDNPPTVEETIPKLCRNNNYSLDTLEQTEGGKKHWNCLIHKS